MGVTRTLGRWGGLGLVWLVSTSGCLALERPTTTDASPTDIGAGDAGVDDTGDTSDPRRTDVFVTVAPPKADVLVAVDSSTSMLAEQRTLAIAGAALLDALNISGVDWRLGVVTMDMVAEEGEGRLREVSGVRFVERTTEDVTSVFGDLVEAGNSGNSRERGLDAVLAAAQPIDADVRTFNAGFLREDAPLHVVFVSDENDASVVTSALFVEWFEAFGVGTQGGNSAHAIVGRDGDTCGSGPVLGQAYLDVVDAVEGTTESICASSFEDFMSGLAVVVNAEFVSTTIRRFTLSKVPDVDSLSVRIIHGDDVIVGLPEASLGGASLGDACEDAGHATCRAYRFETSLQSVLVLGDPLPSPASVRISYLPAP